MKENREPKNLLTAIFMLVIMLVSPGVMAFDIVKADAEQELVKEVSLRDESITMGFYAGVINFEHFSSGLVYALNVNVPLSESLFIDVEYGQADITDSEFRNIGLPLLEEEEDTATFYSVNIGYVLMPGEVYWSKEKTFISSFYLLAGAGNITIDGEDYFSLNAGFGFRVQLSGGSNVRIEGRDRMMDTDILGSDELTHNLELHAGMSWSFR